MALTLRSAKGSELTYSEMDGNWTGLSDGSFWAAAVSAATSALTIGLGLTITAGGLTVTAGDTVLGDTLATIRSNTADASDNKRLVMGGGGAIGDTRGAHILVGGNESSTPGAIFLSCGDVTGGDLTVIGGGVTRFIVPKTGAFSFQSITASGNFSGDIAGATIFGINVQSSTDPKGISISYSAMAPNDSGHIFLQMSDSTQNRAFFTSNGGLSNFSANNVNLSDRKVKGESEILGLTLLQQLEDAYLATPWGRYKYKDQTHNDWNYGPTDAQGVAAAFNGLVPITEVWNPSKEVTSAGGEKVTVSTPEAEQLLGIYTNDLDNISHALLAHNIRKVRSIVAALAVMGITI